MSPEEVRNTGEGMPEMGEDLIGKTALVTGAGSGIGRATAMELGRRSVAVVVNDLSEQACNRTVAEIREAGGTAMAAPADVSVRAQLYAAVSACTAELGSIDILVNNAGISSNRRAFDEITDDDLQRMFGINVNGAFYATQIVLEGMKERTRGCIVNVASIFGLVGAPRSSHYCGAKAAVLGFTKAWAKEFARWNITVNAVAPGGTLTAMTDAYPNYAAEAKNRVPLGRFGEPEEIAHTIVFLATVKAHYITGQVISPNGGEVIY